MLNHTLLALAVLGLMGCQRAGEEDKARNTIVEAKAGARASAESGCPQESPCPVSLYALISDPVKWDGKYVHTFGYFAVGRHAALFADQESSEYSILRNGISVNLDHSIKQHGFEGSRSDEWVPVTGLFVSRTPQRDELGQTMADDFSGELRSAKVFPYRSDAWSCSSASQSMKKRYSRGADACFAHDAAKVLKEQE